VPRRPCPAPGRCAQGCERSGRHLADYSRNGCAGVRIQRALIDKFGVKNDKSTGENKAGRAVDGSWNMKNKSDRSVAEIPITQCIGRRWIIRN